MPEEGKEEMNTATTAETEENQATASEANAPIITMKGLSGKKIASVVKVVKIKKKSKPEEDGTNEGTAEKGVLAGAKSLLADTKEAVKAVVKQSVGSLSLHKDKTAAAASKKVAVATAKEATAAEPSLSATSAAAITSETSSEQTANDSVTAAENVQAAEPVNATAVATPAAQGADANTVTETAAAAESAEIEATPLTKTVESTENQVASKALETTTAVTDSTNEKTAAAQVEEKLVKATDKLEKNKARRKENPKAVKPVLDNVNVTLPAKLGKIADINQAAINRAREQREKEKEKERRNQASKKAVEATKALENMRRKKLEKQAPQVKVPEITLTTDFVVPKPIGKVKLPPKYPAAKSKETAAGNASANGNFTRGGKPGFRSERNGFAANKSHGGAGNSYAFADKDQDEERKPVSHSRKPKTASRETEIVELLAKEAPRRNFQNKDVYKKRPEQEEKTKKPIKGNMRNERRARFDNFDEEETNERRRGKRKSQNNVQNEQNKAAVTHVSLPEQLTVKEFAEAIKKTASEVIMKLMNYGVMVNMNQEIDYDTAATIADEFGITCDKLVEVTEEDILFDDSDDVEGNLEERPPVVVVMGHVDHGKTTLLDHIRNANVASGEAGGITQHIGAYTVSLNNRRITFLDTPGHEAFTTMRARGAQATDIAILVVAADDGVMPQTVEAINHAKAAKTEIIVAINKMDKPGANPDRVKQELATYDLLCEEWGGSTVMVPISAKTGENVDKLLEMVLLTADMMELKADPHRQAKGIVLEASLDKNKGVIASLLVQRGTLKKGDTIVTGSIVGNVRAMIDSRGKHIAQAGPSVPVQIIGLPEIPEAGETFYQVTDEKMAKQLADKRRDTAREEQIRQNPKISLDALYNRLEEGKLQDLNIIVKGDVVGSVEAMNQSLQKLSNDQVKINIIHSQAGGITESDVRLAEVSDAIIIGFNVRPNNNVTDLAKELGVDIRLYRVIYNAIEDIEKAMKGMLAPTYEEKVLGHVEVRETFKVSSVGTIAGAYVTDGKATRNAGVRLLRDDKIIYEGKLGSLKRFKDDVKEVNAGYECGLSIENYNDIKVGDTLELFEMVEVKEE